MADKVVVVRLRAAVGEYTSGFARAGGATVTFAGQVAGAARSQDQAMDKARTTMSNLATGAAIAGKLILAGIGGAMVVSAKAAIDFESSLAGVAKTVDGTAEQIEAIGSSMRRLSLRVPVNVNELNRIAELGGQLGVEIPNLVEFTEVIAALGVTTNLSTEDAATGLARLANVTGLTQDAYSNLGSTIVDLGNNFATTESEILTFSLRIAPAAQTVGATADEVLGLAAALSSMGIPAERGGTAIQTMFTIMASAARTGGDELRVMAATAGQTADQFGELILASPTDALVTLAEGLGQVNQAGGNVFGLLRDMGISGRRAQAVVLAMANNTGLLRDALDDSNTAFEENTALFEEAAKRYGTTASEIRLMANAFNDLRIELGTGLIDGIKSTITFISALFQVMRDNVGVVELVGKALLGLGIALTTLGIAKAVGAMLGMVTALKTTLAAAGGLVRTVGILRASLGLLGGAIGIVSTIALVGLGVAAANAAAKLARVKEAAANFRLDIETGESEADALANVLETLTETDPSRLANTARALELAGLGIDDLIAAALEGPGAIADLIQDLKDVQNPFQAEGREGFITDADIQKGQEMAAFINDATSLAEQLGGVIEQDVSSRAKQMTLDLFAAGQQGVLTFDEISARAERFARENPLATGQDFVMSQSVVDSWMFGLGDVASAIDTTGQTWDQFITGLGLEDDVIGQFFEDSAALADEWASLIAEDMEAVSESIRSGFPAWDEYEQQQKVSLANVIAAQDRFLEDMRVWADLQPEIMENSTRATQTWLDSLDPILRGGLARAWGENFDLMISDLAALDENFAELAQIDYDAQFGRIPGAIDRANNNIRPKMAELIAMLPLPEGDDEKVTGAYRAGMEQFFDQLPETVGPVAKDNIHELMSGENLGLFGVGFTAFTDWMKGFEAAMRAANIPGLATNLITTPFEDRFRHDFEISSPSKVAMRIGEDFIDGLFIGAANRLEALPLPRALPSLQATFANSAQAGTTTQTTTNSPTINIHNPVTQSPFEDTRNGLAVSALVGAL